MAVRPVRLPPVGWRREETLEDGLALLAFVGAALAGLAGHVRIRGYLHDRRWLRVTAFAVAFFVIAAIITGGMNL
jgi:hypothetical protein